MNVQVAGKSFYLIMFICPGNAFVKKGKSEMSFKSIIKPSHLISDIAASHVCGVRKARNEGNRKSRVFITKRVRTQCHIFGVPRGCVVVVRQEVMKYTDNSSQSPHSMIYMEYTILNLLNVKRADKV